MAPGPELLAMVIEVRAAEPERKPAVWASVVDRPVDTAWWGRGGS